VRFGGARTDAERPRGFFAGRDARDLSQRVRARRTFDQDFLGLVENTNMRCPGMSPMTPMPVSRNAGPAVFCSAGWDLRRRAAEALPARALELEPDRKSSKAENWQRIRDAALIDMGVTR
jgi:hypothetical protein